jgi:hypothetical protein
VVSKPNEQVLSFREAIALAHRTGIWREFGEGTDTCLELEDGSVLRFRSNYDYDDYSPGVEPPSAFLIKATKRPDRNGQVRCQCPHENCGALFVHHGRYLETTVCPECLRQQAAQAPTGGEKG